MVYKKSEQRRHRAKIKICGLFRDEDTDYVNEALPDYAGFVFYEKSHRNIDLETAARLRARLDKRIMTVGVFVDEPLESMVQYCIGDVLDVVQLHGHEDNAYIEALRRFCRKQIWQAFKIRSHEDVLRANASAADMLVLDNGKGTGKSFDWSLLKGVERQFFLAGGINTENIGEALKICPYGIDVSSGAETDKVKDRDKIKYIVKECRK
ncbi:MAG: phosphoribosylanthranilate isomerase [Firmicutes bacterium]|nr:phosphoribosylanthranilate isomerase [Bacillota bacterium]